MSASKKGCRKGNSQPKEIRVALVLGSGSIRSVAHIGVLEVLEANSIPIDLIVGSGSGSIIAAMYAYYRSSRIVLDKFASSSIKDFIDISWFNYFRLLISPKGLCEGRNFQKMLVHQLPGGDMDELSIPLIFMATDIDDFSSHQINSGNTIQSVLASAALPPFFSPIPLNDKLFIAGGVASPVPADVARKCNAKIVIAVDIAQHNSVYNTKNMLQITYRSLDIAFHHLAKFQGRFADIVINPRIPVNSLEEITIMDIYNEGKKEAMKALPAIKKLIDTLKIKKNK